MKALSLNEVKIERNVKKEKKKGGYEGQALGVGGEYIWLSVKGALVMAPLLILVLNLNYVTPLINAYSSSDSGSGSTSRFGNSFMSDPSPALLYPHFIDLRLLHPARSIRFITLVPSTQTL